MPLQNFKGSWIEYWRVLVLPNVTLMTLLFLMQADHMHRLLEVFGRLKEHNLKFHLNKCQLFHT
jgi:hypothetical protein